jgi:hypothetical protein
MSRRDPGRLEPEVKPAAVVPPVGTRGVLCVKCEHLNPITLDECEAADFSHRYLQPMDNPQRRNNTEVCIAQCLQRPAWRLSLQTHKITGIR